jgi:hypothetical protein
MIKPIRFNPQDLLTQSLIDSHALAIQELQAIVGGQSLDHRDIEQTLVYIENYSDLDLEFAAVVGLENPVHKEPTTDPATFMYSDIAFTTIVPSVASGHEGRFAVLQQAIPKSGRGLAIIQGVVRVKVIFATGTEKWADITDGSTATLTAAATGSARILWREGSGAGTVWCACLIGCGGAGGGGTDTSASFTAHYSMSRFYESYPEECTFWTLTGCLNSFLQIALDVRRCQENVYTGNHPGNTKARANGGFAGNCIASWLGDDSEWIELAYTARDKDGVIIGTGVQAITDFHIHARVTTAGLLELRTTNDSLTLSCVISGAVWRKSYPGGTGTIEFGAGGCHDDRVWGDGVWEPPT